MYADADDDYDYDPCGSASGSSKFSENDDELNEQLDVYDVSLHDALNFARIYEDPTSKWRQLDPSWFSDNNDTVPRIYYIPDETEEIRLRRVVDDSLSRQVKVSFNPAAEAVQTFGALRLKIPPPEEGEKIKKEKVVEWINEMLASQDIKLKRSQVQVGYKEFGVMDGYCYVLIDKDELRETVKGLLPADVELTKDPDPIMTRELVKSVKVHPHLPYMREFWETAEDALNTCIVAFDTEAAVVLKDAMAVPNEFSFAALPAATHFARNKESVTPAGAPANVDFRQYHSFVHPGFIDDENVRSAYKLSTCELSGGHGIPFRNCSFLRTDYDDIACEIDAYATSLFEEYRVELEPQGKPAKMLMVCKGLGNDERTLKWLHAACESYGLDVRMDSVAVIDVACVADRLAELVGTKPRTPPPAAKKVLVESVEALEANFISCDYHKIITPLWMNGEVIDNQWSVPHCALRDAVELAKYLHNDLLPWFRGELGSATSKTNGTA